VNCDVKKQQRRRIRNCRKTPNGDEEGGELHRIVNVRFSVAWKKKGDPCNAT
jgi:hypothetical protein